MKLKMYLKIENISVTIFSKRIGVSFTAVNRYINGERIPRPETMLKIFIATDGLVAPNDFILPDDDGCDGRGVSPTPSVADSEGGITC